jgi:hypothetical protein
VLPEPGFPVDVVGATELHATFREESRSLFSAIAALKGNSGEPQALLWFSSKGKARLAILIKPP